jgi:hypothetical protein
MRAAPTPPPCQGETVVPVPGSAEVRRSAAGGTQPPGLSPQPAHRRAGAPIPQTTTKPFANAQHQNKTKISELTLPLPPSPPQTVMANPAAPAAPAPGADQVADRLANATLRDDAPPAGQARGFGEGVIR